ncbi:MAG: hypothetical protein AAB250_06950 [Bdellovibrionota bacterium]
MKAVMMSLLVLVGTIAHAANSPSNDFSRSTNEMKQLSVEDLSYRLHVTGEIFLVSNDGEKLVNIANETREWEFSGDESLISNWVYQAKGQPLVAIAHEWKIQTDGRVTLKIKHYDSIERGKENDVQYGKLLKEEDFTIKNFAPVETVIASGTNKLVVRLTPGVWNQEAAIDVGTLPISGRNMVIYDSRGNVWAEGVEGDSPGTFFGAVTHQGALFISFVPFKGAKVIGNAKGGRIKVRGGDRGDIFILSETPFVPRGAKVNVYGLVRSGTRTERMKSVRTYTSNKEDAFLERIPGN